MVKSSIPRWVFWAGGALVLVLAVAVVVSQLLGSPRTGGEQEIFVDVEPLVTTDRAYLRSEYQGGVSALRLPPGDVLGISEDGQTVAFRTQNPPDGGRRGAVFPTLMLIDVSSGEVRDTWPAERCGQGFVGNRVICSTGETDENDNYVLGTHVIADVDVNTGESTFKIPIDDWAVDELRVLDVYQGNSVLLIRRPGSQGTSLMSISADGDLRWRTDAVDRDCVIRGDVAICTGRDGLAERQVVQQIELTTGEEETLFIHPDPSAPHPTADGHFRASLGEANVILDWSGEVVEDEDVYLAGVLPRVWGADVGHPLAALNRGRTEASQRDRAYLPDGTNVATGIFRSMARDGEDERNEYTWHHVGGGESITLRADAEAITSDGEVMVFTSGRDAQEVHFVNLVTGETLLTHDPEDISVAFMRVTDGILHTTSAVSQDNWVYLPAPR